MKGTGMKKLAFIGVGNMATAIIGAVTSGNIGVSFSDLVIFDKFSEKCEGFKNKGAAVANSVTDAVREAEYVLLAVKPQNIAEVLGEIKDNGISLDNKVFISIAAGVSIGGIRKHLATDAAVVRCMPNTPLQIGLGVTALCHSDNVSEKDFDFVRSIFESSGMTLVLNEAQMNTVICVNGSSPAYFYYFIDAMVKSAEAQGLKADNLTEAICRTVIGSAEMLIRSGKTAEELIRAVTSPKGTTERAMNELRGAEVDKIIHKAMVACTERAEEMSKEIN